MELVAGRALVAQGGGPTAVINQSLVGVVLEARNHPQITGIYGAEHGIQGIVEENLVDLSEVDSGELERVAATPSSALFSTRMKPTPEVCARIFEVCKAHDVRFFFYIGGNDSADTCRIVQEEAERGGYALRVIHVPKTVDNDLKVTDHCPGFGSAAKFVAQAFMGANLDNRSLKGVYIGIVMGRHAGFLTAAAALGRTHPDDGPHLVYVPERAISQEQFLTDVKSVYGRLGRCVVAVSEGIVDSDGKAIAEQFAAGEKDAHGNMQLSGTGALGDLLSSWVKEETDIGRVRADTLGYLQRSFAGCVSEVDQVEAREVGQQAVKYAVGDNAQGSVAIKRVGDYSVEYFLTPLNTVARESSSMPENFMNEAGNNVTDAFHAYARPLAGPLYQVARLNAPAVNKIVEAN